MGTKLETLQEKLAKLQADIKVEEQKSAMEKATADVLGAFNEAIKAAITTTETDMGKSLRDIGLGIWLAYPKENPDGELMELALTVGDDGLPAALPRTPSKNGTNGQYENVLGDGRVFEKCEEAVNAMGIDTRDANGECLDGKQYYYRHDRPPKEIAEAITKRAKETTESTE